MDVSVPPRGPGWTAAPGRPRGAPGRGRGRGEREGERRPAPPLPHEGGRAERVASADRVRATGPGPRADGRRGRGVEGRKGARRRPAPITDEDCKTALQRSPPPRKRRRGRRQGGEGEAGGTAAARGAGEDRGTADGRRGRRERWSRPPRHEVAPRGRGARRFRAPGLVRGKDGRRDQPPCAAGTTADASPRTRSRVRGGGVSGGRRTAAEVVRLRGRGRAGRRRGMRLRTLRRLETVRGCVP